LTAIHTLIDTCVANMLICPANRCLSTCMPHWGFKRAHK